MCALISNHWWFFIYPKIFIKRESSLCAAYFHFLFSCFVALTLVYVKFDDITAEDFLHVQMDIDYRKEWDRMYTISYNHLKLLQWTNPFYVLDTAVTLDVIDSDPLDDQQVI